MSASSLAVGDIQPQPSQKESHQGYYYYVQCRNTSFHLERVMKSLSPSQALKKMKVLLSKFTAFKPRYLHLYAYKKHIQSKHWKARKLLAAAVQEAKNCGSIFDAEWASSSLGAWFKDACMEATTLEMGFVLP